MFWNMYCTVTEFRTEYSNKQIRSAVKHSMSK